jgi:hypothetical protein
MNLNLKIATNRLESFDLDLPVDKFRMNLLKRYLDAASNSKALKEEKPASLKSHHAT